MTIPNPKIADLLPYFCGSCIQIGQSLSCWVLLLKSHCVLHFLQFSAIEKLGLYPNTLENETKWDKNKIK